MIERGAPWGGPTDEPADAIIRGGDADLAAAVAGGVGPRIRFEPDDSSDLARALGLRPGGSGPEPTSTVALPIDVLAIDDGSSQGVAVAVNAVVLGAPPPQLRWATFGTGVCVAVDGRSVFEGRATTVVVANGEFLDGDDVSPRGHPGDGRAEVQVYALRRGERREMRKRLAGGMHVPHPRIFQVSGRSLVVRAPARLPLVVDGHPRGAPDEVRIEVRPGALTLVV